MNKGFDLFNIKSNKKNPKKGNILISKDFPDEVYFNQSVVLLTKCHENEAVGFVLNKPLKLSKQDKLNLNIANFEADVFFGGPVDTDRMYYIHTLPNLIPGSVPICKNLYWGGDFSVLKQLMIERKIPSCQLRFFIGYSGWTTEQLKGEIEENFWLVSSTSTKNIMNHLDAEDLWKHSLRDLGVQYYLCSNFPENPLSN